MGATGDHLSVKEATEKEGNNSLSKINFKSILNQFNDCWKKENFKEIWKTFVCERGNRKGGNNSPSKIDFK